MDKMTDAKPIGPLGLDFIRDNFKEALDCVSDEKTSNRLLTCWNALEAAYREVAFGDQDNE